MSSRANDRHIIWGDINLDFEDWKDDLSEQYPDLSEEELMQKMYEINADYLDDERMNLNVQLSQPILVVADIGRWNGRFNGYAEIKSGKICDCLYSEMDMCEWYVDKYGDLRADAVHHDGINHYLYRVYKDTATDSQIENLKAKELFTHGSLNTFAKQTNVDTDNRLICYDILDLGKQLMPIGMLVVLDSILNRITQNRAKGKNTYIFIDEIYLLFQHEYSANFLFTLWKRVRKYGAFATGITQNVDDLLQSHTARTMLANSEFIIMLNQASTDRLKLAELLNISDLQMSYITNVEAGHGLIKVGSSLVPFENKFPKNTRLYKLMTTKPGESS